VALSVSPAIRIVALIGLLLALVAGGAMRFMGGASGSATDVVPSRNSAIVRAKNVASHATARAKKPTAASTPTTHASAATKPRAVTPAKTTAKPAAKPARSTKSAAPALNPTVPLALGRALAFNPTVVAVLYNPQSEVDGIAVAEARAGAALASVGFVALNVLSQADVGKLTEQLGLLPDPAVLVFRRPAKLAARIDGFSDKETVAQAAQNAAHGT
jgi:hypothetical protein